MLEIRIQYQHSMLKIWEEGDLVAKGKCAIVKDLPSLFSELITERYDKYFNLKAKRMRYARKRSDK